MCDNKNAIANEPKDIVKTIELNCYVIVILLILCTRFTTLHITNGSAMYYLASSMILYYNSTLKQIST